MNKLMTFFSCQDFGWSCIKRQPEYEVQVDQGEQLYYNGIDKEVIGDQGKNYIERTNCFVIVKQLKKIDKIKKITVRRTDYLKNYEYYQNSNSSKKKKRIIKCSMHIYGDTTEDKYY